jgi:hypothetical protein
MRMCEQTSLNSIIIGDAYILMVGAIDAWTVDPVQDVIKLQRGS